MRNNPDEIKNTIENNVDADKDQAVLEAVGYLGSIDQSSLETLIGRCTNLHSCELSMQLTKNGDEIIHKGGLVFIPNEEWELTPYERGSAEHTSASSEISHAPLQAVFAKIKEIIEDSEYAKIKTNSFLNKIKFNEKKFIEGVENFKTKTLLKEKTNAMSGKISNALWNDYGLIDDDLY